MKKPDVGRNDPCPCGSGKKYKKCCEAKLAHKKFHAEVINPSTANSKLTGFFQRNVPTTALPEKKHEENKPDLII